MSISVKRPSPTLVFFKASCNANPVGERKLAGLSSYVSNTYFESSQIHHLTIMHHFEHTNDDILVNILFQNLYKLFLRAFNLHQ